MASTSTRSSSLGLLYIRMAGTLPMPMAWTVVSLTCLQYVDVCLVRLRMSRKIKYTSSGEGIFRKMSTALVFIGVLARAQLPAVDDVPRLWPQPVSVTGGGGSDLILDPKSFRMSTTFNTSWLLYVTC